MAAMATQYWCSCPHGDECKKRGQRLGSFTTSDAAREKVRVHLMQSSYHYMSEADALLESESAVINEEEVEAQNAENDWVHKEQGKGKGKGQSWWKKDTWHERPAPYAKAAAEPSAPSAAVVIRAPPVNLATILSATSRAEAAARTAGRMARAAANAFEEEAHVLREAMDLLRSASM